MNMSTKLITEVDMERLSTILDDRVRDRETAERLGDLLSSFEVVDAEKAPNDLVTMNSLIRGLVKSGNGAADELRTFRLVYPRIIGADDGCISVLTPFGMRLLGSRVGDVVDWRGNDGGTREMVLEDVLYQPEASGDWHL